MPTIITNVPKLNLRFATRRDLPVVISLIQELSEYEERPQDMTATAQNLSSAIFTHGYAEVLLAEYEGLVVGYTLFYPTFSSFSGTLDLYIEDLYMQPSYRNLGFGKEILKQLAKLAQKRGWENLHWTCLDWNELSISFYEHIGAEKQLGRSHFVLSPNAQIRLICE